MDNIEKIVIYYVKNKNKLINFLQKYTELDVNAARERADQFPFILTPVSNAECTSMKKDLQELNAYFRIEDLNYELPPFLRIVNDIWPILDEILEAKVVEYINVADKKRSQIMWSGIATIVANTVGGANLSSVAVGGTGMAMAATMGDSIVMEVSLKNNEKWKVLMTINEYTVFTNELKRINESKQLPESVR